MGARRSRAAGGTLDGGPLAIAGICGGLADGLRPGTWWWQLRSAPTPAGAVLPLPAAPLLATALRRHGLTVHVGPVVSTDRLVTGAAKARLATTGALAVDLESASLLPGPQRRPVACVRVVADTAGDGLWRPATLDPVRVALRALPAVVPALAESAEADRRCAGWCSPRRAPSAPASSGPSRSSSRPWNSTRRRSTSARQIVHNAQVVRGPRARGAVFVDELDEVPDGADRLLRARVSPVVRRTAAERG